MICRHCGLSEEKHHAFEAVVMPAGCICNPTDWRDIDHIPPICAAFAADPEWPDQCATCEHCKECHTEVAQ